MRILQIIPNLPSVSCGVGDYARLLSENLAGEHAISSQFLVPLQTGSPSHHPAPPSGYHYAASSGASLLESLETLYPDIDAVVLQFSPYGYQQRGIPFGLLKALQALLHRHPGLTLHTMFHELYATGPITTSAFWLGFLQKQIIRRLARLSHRRFTNRSLYARWIESVSPQHSSPVAAIPVFSNLGEALRPPLPSSRPAAMTLFRSGLRSEVDWEALQPHWEAAQVSQIHFIGRGNDLNPPPGFPLTVINHGHLPASQVTSLLQQTRLGYLDYYPGYLGKSGIFAAYAAHGIPTLLKKDAASTEDGLQKGMHYTLMESTAIPLPALNALSAHALTWYAPHSLHATTNLYAAALQP